MKCAICDSKENWKNVDEYRIKPEGMCMCTKCGFVSYPEKYQTKQEIIDFYREDYRSRPSVGNLYTGETKLNYHNAFLGELLAKWNKDDKKRSVFEVGSAYGIFLNWMRKTLKNCDVAGTEITTSYKRNAFHEYGIDLKDDFDDTKKYDLICSYKVLEHQMDPDYELRRYAECLTKDGFIYLSIPVWFNRLNNFGAAGFDVEYYYHTNHINVWSLQNVYTLLNKCGLEIVKENDFIYDHTWLLKRNDSLMKKEPAYAGAENITNCLKQTKSAADFYIDQKFKEAISCWADFPDAYRNHYEKNRAEFHKVGIDEIEKSWIDKAKEACPNSVVIVLMAADIYMRYEKFDKAIKELDVAIQLKPNDSTALLHLSHCFRALFKKTNDINHLLKARDICRHVAMTNSQMRPEAISFIYHDNAEIPINHAVQETEETKVSIPLIPKVETSASPQVSV